MGLYSLLRPLLFRFDPERVHELVFHGLAGAEALARLLPRQEPLSHPALVQQIWGVRFPNPIGLAAGLDKNARAPHVWPWLGFGFAELGTITALPQPGNPKPRIFRLPGDRALINRLGFNNAGAEATAARLEALWCRYQPCIPIGINLGKSKVTSLADAAADYARSLRALFRFAAYVAVNVSSPNTPGLRDLQAEEHLAALLAVVCRENEAIAREQGTQPRPVLVKIAPDVADSALPGIVAVTRGAGAHGLIATNTTLRRDGLSTAIDEGGGLSGAPLRRRSTEVIRSLRRAAGPDLPIIGVGGVFTADDAYEKIRAGAALVQIYTSLIYAGPGLPRRIVHGLVELLRRDGFAHIGEAIGRDA